jgi:hypothetical protein
MVHRSGISRANVLVALLIVLVGAGLLSAVVQRVREAANGMKCSNNLRQFGLAVHNHYSTYQRLPPLVDQGDGAPTGRGLPSVFANLIPFVESTPYRFRPERPPDHYLAHSSVMITYMNKDGSSYLEGGGMVNQFWPMFIDPADGTANKLRDIPMTLPDGTTGYYSTGSYAANGLVPWGTRFFEEFPVGLANTILFSERPQVCRTAAGETVYNLWGLGIYSPHMPAFSALTPNDPPGLWSTGQIAPALLPDEDAADRDALIRVRIGRRSAEPGVPDFPTPVQFVRRGEPCDPRLPGTPHRAGMQVAMADGSVRVFTRDTSPWVFWSTCTPAKMPVGE